MNISELFIRRPVATSLLMLAIVVFGLLAYRRLPVNHLPSVDYPTIQVTARLPGASPETMASAVATPLERQFSTIAGVDAMTSTNGQGISIITLKFALDRDIDAAAQDVQSAIAKAQRQLPQDMPTPPSFQKVNPADQAVLYIALSSPTMPLHQVNEYADTMLAQRISMVNGVAQVTVNGSQKYAVRVQLDPRALVSRGIGLDEVATSIGSSNVNLPTGTLQDSHKALTIQAEGQLFNAAAYQQAIIAWKNGAPVRVQDVGSARDGVENERIAAWYNTPSEKRRAIVLAVQRQPGTNTVEVVDAIKALLPAFQAQLPASLSMEILYDRTVSIRESVHEVKFTLVLTVCLVILVIFLFLRNLPATLIPSLAVPLSIIGTFGVMYALGFSINNVSLLALTLSVGFVVDDAIVMLENIVRHMEQGEPPLEAAFKGSREIGFTILSMTISLVAVFIPVLFMPGMLGRILHEFAVTISVAILISGIVSLTLTPMLCSRFLAHGPQQTHGKAYQWLEQMFQRLLALYESSLQLVLRYRQATLVFVVASTVLTVWLFTRMPAGLFSSEDTGALFGITEASQGISFEDMVRQQQLVADIVRQNPNVAAFMSSAGASGSRVGSNSGFMFIRLKPRSERRLSADQVIQQLRSKLAHVPGIMVYLQNPPPIRLDATLSKGQYQLALMSPDTSALYRAAADFEMRLKGLPILQDVTSDLQMKNPELRLTIDRERAASLGVSPKQIQDALYYAYGSRQISTIYAPSNQYQVILELEPRYQADPAALGLLYVRSSSGQLVPLTTLTTSRPAVGPLTVNHLGQATAVTVAFNIKPGVPLGEAVKTIEREARAGLPAGITTAFQGTAQVFQQSTKGLVWLLIAAIAVIYIVLGILYESYIHPVTILSGLPSAGLGALATLLLFNQELNLYAFVGIIMLVGIVKKNAIMMIDFALEAQRKEGLTPAEAIYQGCIIRFRPIMMTTMAALMGTLPIAVGIGAGGDARRPLGLAVVGGLVVSQLLTLYITPVVYWYLDTLQERLRSYRSRR